MVKIYTSCFLLVALFFAIASCSSSASMEDDSNWSDEELDDHHWFPEKKSRYGLSDVYQIYKEGRNHL